jgi:hypothetical protein
MRIALLLASALITLGLASPLRGASEQEPPRTAVATCDASAIDPESYRLTTEAQALNVLRPREPWWEPYGLWKGPREIGTVNEGALALAERASELDDRNRLAHGYLARQMVAAAVDARKAEGEWRRVLDNGGAVVWTVLLPRVDLRSFFVLAFRLDGVHVFRFTQIAGPVPTAFGFQEFPDPDRQEFWRAHGGSLPDGLTAETVIPWSRVRSVRVNRTALRFELADDIVIRSDRGQRRSADTLEVLPHGQPGQAWRMPVGPFRPRPYYGPAPSQDAETYLLRIRQMLIDVFGVRGDTPP